MTNEEAKEKIFEQWQEFLENNIDYAGISEAYKMAISALEAEPCDDAVSRQYLIDIATKDGAYDYVSAQEIANAPSVRPQEQKTGHWIPIYQGDEIINYRCSECELGDTNGSTNLYGWDYCRRSGAKMDEPTCDTCEYNTASFMPCNACEDKSEYEPRESEEEECML